MEGHNQADADLKRRANALKDILDQIAELQEEAKEIRADAKSDGYDLKALNQVVKELRRGAEYQEKQLELELVLDTYRKAVGLPVTLDAAQEIVRRDAEELPAAEEDGEGKRTTRRRADLN